MLKLVKIYFFITIAILSACAVEKDPAKAGLVDGIINLSRGTYQERIEERRDRLHAMRQIKDQATTEQYALESEADRRTNEARQLKNKIAALDTEASNLGRRIKRLESKSKHTRKDTSTIRKKLAAVQAEMKRLRRTGSTVSEKEITEKKRRVKELEDDLEKLGEIIETME